MAEIKRRQMLGGRRHGEESASSTRRCAVTRKAHPKEKLVRFVMDPKGQVVPDIACKLPGRGYWITSRRDVLDVACERGPFALNGGRDHKISNSLSSDVEILLGRRVTETLGLLRRAGQAVGGFQKVRRSLVGDTVAILIFADDADPDRREELARLSSRSVMVDILTAAELGAVFGRERVAYAAVFEGNLAKRFEIDAGRLAGFRANT